MPSIRILPDKIVNQIAAGEVIERPASVVKELVENSLDAGATKIEVEFRQAGKNYIRIEDNGCGMSSDEVVVALERHATSKLALIEDLLALHSFGFRGEALPSIASISRMTIKTRRKQDANGTEVLINAGKILHKVDCGVAPGTRIEVEHLFNSVPSRRAFLKTDNTEAAHITHLCRLYAVANPGVSFTLIENGSTIFKSPKCAGLKDRIGEIWGWHLVKELIDLDLINRGDMKLWGVLGKPSVSRATRLELVTLVNQRPVDSRTLNSAILESYHGYIPKGRYPVAFLFLEMSPTMVDVNVHPAKREVRFRQEGLIREFLMHAIHERLQEFSREAVSGWKGESGKSEARQNDAKLSEAKVANAKCAETDMPRPVVTPLNAPVIVAVRTPSLNVGGMQEVVKVEAPVLAVSANPETGLNPNVHVGVMHAPVPNHFEQEIVRQQNHGLLNWDFVGRLKDRWVLFRSEVSLIVMDVQAAWQRIRYEEILGALTSEAHQSMHQPLLIPIPIELDPLLDAVMKDAMPFLGKEGFKVELFGRNFYRIESIPDWIQLEEAEMFIRDFLGMLREKSVTLSQPKLLREPIARLVSQGTRGDWKKMSADAELIRLAQDLLKCQQPLSSPSGKPTVFDVSFSDLERYFSR